MKYHAKNGIVSCIKNTCTTVNDPEAGVIKSISSLIKATRPVLMRKKLNGINILTYFCATIYIL